MSAEHDDKKPATISLVPSVLAFGVSTVAALGGMVLIMLYNYNGGF
jgi:hypothetical protein